MQIRTILISLLFFLSSFRANAQTNSNQYFYIKPYVTNVTATKAEIIWLEPVKSIPIKVYINGNSDLTTTSFIKSIKNRSEAIHIAKIEGLQQNTVYKYHINRGKKKFSGTFKTAVVKDTVLNFMIYGDTRTLPWRHRRVAKQISKDNPDFVICTGDLVADGDKFKQWKKQFFNPASSYLNNSVIWPVRGNHERDGYYFYELFNTNNDREYYSFDYANLHVVVIDQFSSSDSYEQLYKWLEEDLAKNSSLWTIISYHKPSFNVGGHASHWGRDIFLPLFEKYGVDVIVTGHSHLYERFLPISTTGAKPIIHIVSGGGGAPPSWPKKSILLEGGSGKSRLHYLNFKIDGNVLKMSANNKRGHAFDEMVLVKENGRYQKQVMEKVLNFDDIKNN